jgi:hypothetical protein
MNASGNQAARPGSKGKNVFVFAESIRDHNFLPLTNERFL